jgi:hypothetical protein
VPQHEVMSASSMSTTKPTAFCCVRYHRHGVSLMQRQVIATGSTHVAHLSSTRYGPTQAVKRRRSRGAVESVACSSSAEQCHSKRMLKGTTYFQDWWQASEGNAYTTSSFNGAP